MMLPLLFMFLATTLGQDINEDNFRVFEKATNPDAQYAVLYVTGSNEVEPMVGPTPIALTPTKPIQIGKNYVAALPVETKPSGAEAELNLKHSEPQVLSHFTNLIGEYEKTHKNDPPRVYLYTKNSPCCDVDWNTNTCKGGCALIIKKFVVNKLNPTAKFFLSYSQIYDQDESGVSIPEKKFFASLNTILSTGKVTLAIKPPNMWLQREMFSCLSNKPSTRTIVNSKSNILKMINKLSWDCALDSGTPSICWLKALTEILDRRPCNALAAIINKCFIDVLGGFKVGPPIDPNQRDIVISSNFKDLKGDYFPLKFKSTVNFNKC